MVKLTHPRTITKAPGNTEDYVLNDDEAWLRIADLPLIVHIQVRGIGDDSPGVTVEVLPFEYGIEPNEYDALDTASGSVRDAMDIIESFNVPKK